MTFLTRTLLGLALATAIAIAALRARALSRSGALAAVVVGVAATAAGWRWCALVLAFFVSSTLLSRWRREAKERATRAVVEKGGNRDAWQVLANGGVFAACAVGAILVPSVQWSVAGLGALAAATADTWATEVGTAVGGVPRTIVGWREVAPGMSGAMSAAGTLAMIAGAAFLGTVAWRGGFEGWVALAGAVGGVAGAMTDTLLGATMQSRRWCARCEAPTERRVHDCGGPTVGRGGWPRLDNDGVNLTSCAAGAVVALLCGRLA